jgi:predicted dithiol-disulfide oxidoreductase (DUF899 family)
MKTPGNLPEIVSREEWLAARQELLAKEKDVTRARVNADCRRLPMVRMDKPYTFEGPDGPASHARRGNAGDQRVPAGRRGGLHTYSTNGRGIEEFHNGYPWLDLTAFGRQEPWEEPAARAEPLGLQVGGPAMRLPDEYDT